MSVTSTAPVTTVRLTEQSARQLKDLADDTMRAKSQLIRYALTEFLANPTPPTPEPDRQAYPVHIAMRLDADIVARGRALAAEFGVPWSSLLRFAIDRWTSLARQDENSSPARPFSAGGVA